MQANFPSKTPLPRPFEGMKVIDCASFVAGPAASTILAEFGADVIKIEPLEGDLYRHLLPEGATYLFEMDGKARKSIALNLKNPKAMEILKQLVKEADIFVTNTPLPARGRLGIDLESLQPLNPRLIYASLTGYGEIGPDAFKPGFDATAYWARSGLQDTVKPGGDSPPAASIAAMGDHPTALALYASIVTGLYMREKTGKGTAVGTSLYANGLWSSSSLVQGVLEGADIEPPKPHHLAAPLFNAYKCADGLWINLSILNADKLMEPACRILGCPEAATDPRYQTVDSRKEHSASFVDTLDRCFINKPRAQWAAAFDEAGVTYGLVSSLKDVVADPQARVMGAIGPFANGTPGQLTVGGPVEIAGVVKKLPERAPKIGEHTRDVLKSLGYKDGEIEGLVKEGVVGVLGSGNVADARL